MKTLGLIGGTSWHSTIEYYRHINQAVNDLWGDNTNPPLILYNLNQQEIHALQVEDRWDQIVILLSDAVLALYAAGAQAFVFCANTPHRVYPEVSRQTRQPILHVADATGVAIRRAGLGKVGLLGTIYTMQESFIKDWLRREYGVHVVVPASEAARKELHRAIQKELALGILSPETKRFVLQQIADLEAHGAEGVILGCTELPLIVGQADVRIPLFDTTLLHAKLAVDFILGRREARTP